MRPVNRWFLANLTWVWSQSRRGESGPSLFAIRGGLRGDPPARVEPLTVTFKPKTKVVQEGGGVYYSPIKTAWLATCIGTLVALGLVFRNLRAVWASVAKAAPKKGGLSLASDYDVINKQTEKVPGVMPNQEAEITDLLGATCFGKLDMLQGYWQMSLAAEA